MPKIKLESKSLRNNIDIEVSEEITVKEILEIISKQLGVRFDLGSTKVYLKLQKRYLDIDSRLDEEKIYDNEILLIGE